MRPTRASTRAAESPVYPPPTMATSTRTLAPVNGEAENVGRKRRPPVGFEDHGEVDEEGTRQKAQGRSVEPVETIAI